MSAFQENLTVKQDGRQPLWKILRYLDT